MPHRTHIFAQLSAQAGEVAERSFVPYSGRKEAAVALLSDGAWVPGVRVENASFQLSILPVQNAVTTAVTLGRLDVVAIVSSVDISQADTEYVRAFFRADVRAQEPGILLIDDVSLPTPTSELDCLVRFENGVEKAAEVAPKAHVPESAFPVGCIVETGPGQGIPGVNVEHPDWSRILCAERNALGAALSYGYTSFRAIHLACPRDEGATPCGACRQVIVELAPGASVWMDRGNTPPEVMRADSLLPGSFTGTTLRHQPPRL